MDFIGAAFDIHAILMNYIHLGVGIFYLHLARQVVTFFSCVDKHPVLDWIQTLMGVWDEGIHLGMNFQPLIL